MKKEIKKNYSSIQFWEVCNTKDGTPSSYRLIESKLIEFLNQSGYAKTMISQTDYVLVEERKKIVREISDHVIVEHVQNYLIKLGEKEVLEIFTKGVGSYISKPKLRLLRNVQLLNDRDDKDTSWFFFKNKCCIVDKSKIKEVDYSDYMGMIWNTRILKNEYLNLALNKESMFQKFCFHLAAKNTDRFLALQTNLGYLMHRHHDPSNPKAIILVDELINFDGTANGGTGKSLLLKAISQVREMVLMDGKNLKGKSWFKNQRINRTTDVIFYDDVNRDFNLETVYSQLTSGIPVEKKYKPEEYISPENAPKTAISSNYIVLGTGGNTDFRRRCEFEVHNYYNHENTPELEFGCRFFEGWDKYEWSRFYNFMMSCVQKYLVHGLITAKPINLKSNRLISSTCPEFVVYMADMKDIDCWVDKRMAFELFKDEYPSYRLMAIHTFTKWLKEFAKQNGYKYLDRSSGGKYEYIFQLEDTGKEEDDED